jgi:hypothetical protein
VLNQKVQRRQCPDAWPPPLCIGAGAGGTKSLLLGLAGSGTAGGGATAVDDSIVFGVFGHRSRIAQVKAGRAWRRVGGTWCRLVGPQDQAD